MPVLESSSSSSVSDYGGLASVPDPSPPTESVWTVELMKSFNKGKETYMESIRDDVPRRFVDQNLYSYKKPVSLQSTQVLS